MKKEILVLASLLALVGCKSRYNETDGSAITEPSGAETTVMTPGVSRLGTNDQLNNNMRNSNRDMTIRNMKSQQHRDYNYDNQQPNRGFDLDLNGR